MRKARLGPLYRPDVTLQELVDAFLEQYQGAPASRDWLRYYLVKSTDAFGDEPIGSLGVLAISRWRAALPETMRHGAPRVCEGPAEDVREDRAVAASSAAAREGRGSGRDAPAPPGHPLPAVEGGRINIDSWRSREWVPALAAAGLEHRRIYD